MPSCTERYPVIYPIQFRELQGGDAGEKSGSPVPLPDNRNVVPAETAKAEFLKQHPLKLFYIWPEYYGQKAPSPYLVYIPDHGSNWGGYIDAFTGQTVKPENK